MMIMWIFFTSLLCAFWANRLKNRSPYAIGPFSVLSVCPVLSACDVGALWPNGWMDPDETWHAGRPWYRPHCVGWGPSSPPRNGAQQPPLFGPCLLWPNGRPSRQLLSSCNAFYVSLKVCCVYFIADRHKVGCAPNLQKWRFTSSDIDSRRWWHRHISWNHSYVGSGNVKWLIETASTRWTSIRTSEVKWEKSRLELERWLKLRLQRIRCCAASFSPQYAAECRNMPPTEEPMGRLPSCTWSNFLRKKWLIINSLIKT